MASFFNFGKKKKEKEKLIEEEKERTRLLIKERNDYENLIKDTDLTTLLRKYSIFKNKKYYGYVLEKIKRYDNENLIDDLYKIAIAPVTKLNASVSDLTGFGKEINKDETIEPDLKEKIFDAYRKVNEKLQLEDKNYRLLYDPTIEVHKTSHHSNLSQHPLFKESARRGSESARPGSPIIESATPEFEPGNNDLGYEIIPEEGGKRSRRKTKRRKSIRRKIIRRKTKRRKIIRRKSKRRYH
jgi:hypothetical protein